MKIYDELIKLTNSSNIRCDEILKKHSTFKIGGPCDFLVSPTSVLELKNILEFSKKNAIALTVIGNGSNILFSDRGIKGIVIKTTKLNKISIKDTVLTAQCGVKLAKLCDYALNQSLDGLTTLSGIPGTVGGAVYMNAGAYGGEIKDTLVSTHYLNESNEIIRLARKDHQFSYRKSLFSNKDNIILESEFRLSPGEYDEIRQKMGDYINRRNEKQPLNYPSIGSVFKRPEGHFAGHLIEECGLKGYHVGGAYVSKKHSGFIINKGNATAEDVLNLITYIKSTVKNQFNVELETEMKYYGN